MNEILLASALLTTLLLVLALAVMASRRFLLPDRPVALRVNGLRNLPARTGEKLLTALGRGGILIPSACAGAGTCGLCRVRVTAGGGAPLPTEAGHLTRAELASGLRLACQVTLRGDLTVELPEDLVAAETYDCRVLSNRFLTPLIRELVVTLPEGQHPPLVAGSFFQITAPAYERRFADLPVPADYEQVWRPIRALASTSVKTETRAYSVSNSREDTDAGRLVFNIRLALPPPHVPDAPPGVVSSYLFGLETGERLTLSGPFGSFRATGTEREMVFIGGGVGMAPLRAIILDQLERLQSTRPISFWYGARNRQELFYVDELDALAAKHPNFTWTVALSDPRDEDQWEGATGFVHSVVAERFLASHPAPEACEYYLCGPPLMIKAVLAMLADAGVEDDAIFNDDFGV